MKTNLDSLYKTNVSKEKEGEWKEIAPGVRFLIARLGGANADKMKRVNTFHFKPYSRKIQDGSLSSEVETRLLAKCFIEVSLLDWEGITDDSGNEIAFSKESAESLLTDLPELLATLTEFAGDVENYKEDLGNY